MVNGGRGAALTFARDPTRPGALVNLIVSNLDRLARSMKQLIETIEKLRLRRIGFGGLTEALDTATAQGRLALITCLARWRNSSAG
jgi:DNA invertase Pin-like site-specific DNA recombinase